MPATSRYKPFGACVAIGCNNPAERGDHGKPKAMCSCHARALAERAQALDVDGMVALLVEFTGADPHMARQTLEAAFEDKLREAGGTAEDMATARVMFMPGGEV
jgi:hypothetical protein